MYGGASIANDSPGRMRPFARSNFHSVIAPRYFSLYCSIGAYSPPSGAGYCELSIT
jgi:hypothetical protein